LPDARKLPPPANLSALGEVAAHLSISPFAFIIAIGLNGFRIGCGLACFDLIEFIGGTISLLGGSKSEGERKRVGVEKNREERRIVR